MSGRPRGRKPISERTLFRAALAMLSTATILLLAVLIDFFSMPDVRQQLGDWASGQGSQEYNEAVLTAGNEAEPDIVSATGPSTAMPGIPANTSQPAAFARPPSDDPLLASEAAGFSRAYEELLERREMPLHAEGDLIIPALGIETAVITVPVRSSQWDLNGLDDQVGWLETTGAHPGGRMAMVFIGHITVPFVGGEGPFYHLRDLSPGDEIEYRTKGQTYTYKIDRRRAVDPEDVQALYVPGGDRIILVTCERWNPLQKVYDLRLLVEASLIESNTLPYLE